MMIKHQGEVVAVEFTPKYRPGTTKALRSLAVMQDAMNKKDAVLKEHPEVGFGGNTTLVMIQAGKMPVLTTPAKILMLQDDKKGEVKIGIATDKWAKAPEVKSNPSEAVAAAIVDAGKDQKEEMMTTLGKIIPETTQLELANMMSSRGKRAAIDLTMAKMSSGTEPLRSIPSPVSKMLTMDTASGERPVSREKIAYQALGIKPPRSAQIDSRFKTSLRKRITDILGVAGKVTNKAGRAGAIGQLPFIDNHIFLTAQHINDFRQMLTMYHLVRERNAPFMELLVPGFSRDDKTELPLDKMIDYLMPSPDHMFRGERVMFFTTGPTPGQAKKNFREFAKEYYESVFLGLDTSPVALKEKTKNTQAAQRLLRSYRSDTKALFQKVRTATSVLVEAPLTLRFDESMGILPEPKPAGDAEALKWWGVSANQVGRFESDYAVVGAFFEGDDVTLSRFNYQALSPMGKKKVSLQRTGPSATSSINQVTSAGQGPLAGTVGLIPLHNPGFNLPPIGWNRGWMIPTMQIMDEYWYMLGANENVKLEIHDLLYLIGNQAMESMGYEINAQEYLIILLLLGIFDSRDGVEAQTVELTLQQLEDEDSAISKHLKALEELKGEAVQVKEVTEATELTAEEKEALEKMEAEKASEIALGGYTGSPEAPTDEELEAAFRSLGTKSLPPARRRAAKRSSILPFLGDGQRATVGTRYWDKAKITALAKKQRELIESRTKELMKPGNEAVKEMKKAYELSLDNIKKYNAHLKQAFAYSDKATTAVLGKFLLDIKMLQQKLVEAEELANQRVKDAAASAKELSDFKDKARSKYATTMAKKVVELKKLTEMGTQLRPLVDVFISSIERMVRIIGDDGSINALRSDLVEFAKTLESKAKAKKATMPTPASEFTALDEIASTIERVNKAPTREEAWTTAMDWVNKAKGTKGKVKERYKEVLTEGEKALSEDVGSATDAAIKDFIAGVLRMVVDDPERFYNKGKNEKGLRVLGSSGVSAFGTAAKFSTLAEKRLKDMEEPEMISMTSPGTEAPPVEEAETPPAEAPALPANFDMESYEILIDISRPDVRVNKMKELGYNVSGTETDLLTEELVLASPGELEALKVPGPTSEDMGYLTLLAPMKDMSDGKYLHLFQNGDLEVAGEEVVLAVERRSAKRSERSYKGVKIRKLKNGYKVVMDSGDKKFKLLKQAKEYIDASKDKRRAPILEGHTCVYMVGKSPCGGLLYRMKTNPPMHNCRTCGAKYRLEGA